MSNVLIGIIGVILFIGLALAGALFLGPRFQESTNNSKASASVQAISQISNAIELYRTQEGSAYPAENITSTSALVPGYLKAIPTNPMTGSTSYLGLDVGGAQRAGFPIAIVTMVIGFDAKAKAVCEAVQRQSGQLASSAAFDASAKAFSTSGLATNSGCHSNGSNYLVFQKV
jgi:type II secretory pathway pseudopilin PulG